MKELRKFDTKVQHLKYKVLREVAKQAWNNTLTENILDIPKIIVPGKIPTMRCCVYKERAIVAERVKLAMGGNRENPNIIEVIEIACEIAVRVRPYADGFYFITPFNRAEVVANVIKNIKKL